jgi:uncharacterized protein YndB with AHSA1/START domain
VLVSARRWFCPGSGALVAVLLFAAPAAASDRVLRAEVVVPAPVGEVWDAWTTEAGIRSFFAPDGRVDLRVDGTYDVWFNPRGGPDQRGAEGMRILDVDPRRRFVFTWNAPPSIPSIRGRRTVVVLDFAGDGRDRTRLRFTQMGWGDGPDWDKAYAYFDKAWGGFVLPSLVRRFEHGPIDWAALPELAPLPSMRQALTAADGP